MATSLPKQTSVVCNLVAIFNVLPIIIVAERLSYGKIDLPDSVIGPESLAFDADNGGPYTGVSDGRVLKYNRGANNWTQFAVPPRPSGVNREQCSNNLTRYSMEETCGRTLGLMFRRATGDLYICDAYYGLMRVRRKGGVARRLVTKAEGVAFSFTNSLDINQKTGMVYFTDSSSIYKRRDSLLVITSLDFSGRFMRYNPKTNTVKVLIKNLMFPNGVALAKNGSFVLICETTRQRILRYWLKGSKAGKQEVFAVIKAGYPDNIKRNKKGEFWVGINTGKAMVRGVQDKSDINEEEGDRIAMKLGEGGEVLHKVLDDSGTLLSVSEVVENIGSLWFGSVVESFIAKHATNS